MTLKFSPGLIIAALMYVLIASASAALILALLSYSVGLANILIPAMLVLIIGLATIIILWCMKYDRQRSSTRLMAHHREVLSSDEGRPTDQP